ncbi:hypothetical protein GGI35DRAFT_447122 [Trichoderma velutinum]
MKTIVYRHSGLALALDFVFSCRSFMSFCGCCLNWHEGWANEGCGEEVENQAVNLREHHRGKETEWFCYYVKTKILRNVY